MGILFDKDTDTIGLHLKNIYKDEELDEISTTEDFSVVQQEGKRKVNRNIEFYNLDAGLNRAFLVKKKMEAFKLPLRSAKALARRTSTLPWKKKPLPFFT